MLGFMKARINKEEGGDDTRRLKDVFENHPCHIEIIKEEDYEGVQGFLKRR
jgi:hypothetical protein